MLWKRGSQYRHMSCLDIDFYILRINDIDSSAVRLEIVWVNRHNGILYSPPEDVTINFKDYYKWTLLDTQP